MKKGGVWIAMILFYVPNNILLFTVIMKDTTFTRNLYYRWLRFKLITFCFWLPFLALIYDE